jgi:hypothetical protein
LLSLFIAKFSAGVPQFMLPLFSGFIIAGRGIVGLKSI